MPRVKTSLSADDAAQRLVMNDVGKVVVVLVLGRGEGKATSTRLVWGWRGGEERGRRWWVEE